MYFILKEVSILDFDMNAEVRGWLLINHFLLPIVSLVVSKSNSLVL